MVANYGKALKKYKAMADKLDDRIALCLEASDVPEEKRNELTGVLEYATH
jgi:hypothetical protein